MRLQLPKNADPENPHKYWVFEGCCFYKIAAEQKARTTYDNILNLVDNPDVIEPIKFLRQREIVHFQRFGEALEMVKEELDPRNYYYYNPSYPNGCNTGR